MDDVAILKDVVEIVFELIVVVMIILEKKLAGVVVGVTEILGELDELILLQLTGVNVVLFGDKEVLTDTEECKIVFNVEDCVVFVMTEGNTEIEDRTVKVSVTTSKLVEVGTKIVELIRIVIVCEEGSFEELGDGNVEELNIVLLVCNVALLGKIVSVDDTLNSVESMDDVDVDDIFRVVLFAYIVVFVEILIDFL